MHGYFIGQVDQPACIAATCSDPVGMGKHFWTWQLAPATLRYLDKRPRPQFKPSGPALKSLTPAGCFVAPDLFCVLAPAVNVVDIR